MSLLVNGPPPVWVQKSLISGALNSTLMTQFLFGGYLGLWVFTIWTYYNSGKRRRIIPAILTTLFTLTLVQVIIQWLLTYVFFGRNLVDRIGLFYDTWYNSRISILASIGDLFLQISQALTDGLMVWRCCQVSINRRRLRLMVISLYIIEIVSITTCIGMEVFDMLDPDLSVGSIDFDRLYKTLLGATFLFTAVISITASLVIGAQIYYLTAENPRARRRYTHIIEIIIQSSALYSLAIVCQAIETLINAVSSNEEIVLLDAEIYIGTITMFTTAISPTLMVARLSMEHEDATEWFSTNITYVWKEEILSAFAVQPLQSMDTVLQNDSSGISFMPRSRAGEV